jgi:branched-chain amino acid transport system substrate-binding protein
VQLTNPLIAKKVPLIIGSSLVGACNAMAPLVKESGPVLYCLSAGMHPDRSNPYSFTYGVPTDDLIVANLRYLRLRGLKKLAILTSTDASGQDGERGIDAGLALPENKELSVVAREHYATADLSVAAQISRIKESGAQALIAWGTGTPIGTVFHAVNDAGLTIPVSVSASNMIYPEMLQFSSFAPKDLISATPASIALDALPRGALHDAVRDYQEAFKAIGVNADVSQAISWDPAWIVVAALKKFGPAMTAAQFRDYLAGLHGFAGANGVYDFRTGDQRGLGGSQAGIMVRWDAAKQTWVGISKFGGVPK